MPRPPRTSPWFATLGWTGCVLATLLAPPASADARLQFAPCHVPRLDVAAECGTLDVFEARDSSQSRRIALRIVRVPAQSAAPRRDAVFFLAGGPGQGAAALADTVYPALAKVGRKRDLIFVDQRGTGESNPLNCPEPADDAFDKGWDTAKLAALIEACALDLAKRTDLTRYATTDAMRDLDEVRAALGYDAINLVGVSYGTRAALEYARLFAPRIRTLTLDGVAPAYVPLPVAFTHSMSASIQRTLAACEADAACVKAFPRSGEALPKLLNELARAPREVRVLDARAGQRKTVTVTRERVMLALFAASYAPLFQSLVPQAVQRASNDDYDMLSALGGALAGPMNRTLALGMQLSVLCAEDVPRVNAADAEQAARASLFGRFFIDHYAALCARWPKAAASAEYYAPLSSDIPTLLLSGQLDPATPPDYGDRVARTLTRARHVVARNLGHNVMNHACSIDLVAEFIDKADAGALDVTCLERVPRPPFFTGSNAP